MRTEAMARMMNHRFPPQMLAKIKLWQQTAQVGGVVRGGAAASAGNAAGAGSAATTAANAQAPAGAAAASAQAPPGAARGARPGLV